VRLEITVAGEMQVRRVLARMQGRAHDARPALEAMGDVIALNLRRQFAGEASPVGGRWAPLSPAYGRWKHKHHPGKKILHLTGAMETDYTSRPFGIEKLSGTTLEIGSALPYAAFHQAGTDNMPARRLELNEDAKRQMVKILTRFIVEGQVR
jgi:phage gpG-like protein